MHFRPQFLPDFLNLDPFQGWKSERKRRTLRFSSVILNALVHFLQYIFK